MKEKIALSSVFVNLGLALAKVAAGLIISSSSVFAEGIHSGMDVVSSLISLLGIKYAKKPVDKKHPYGHYKFEVLSGLIITVFLFLSGLWIMYKAYLDLLEPKTILLSYFTLIVMAVSVVLNEIMARLKIYYGKKENSLSLLSDGVHDRVDVYASIAVLLGLFIVPYWSYIDPLLAFLIGAYIILQSIKLGKEAVDSLLDASAGEEIENEIKNIANKNNIKISDLKTQKKGSVVTANIEINLPSNFSVEEAAKISQKLKKELIASINSLEYVAVQIKSHDFTDSFFKSRDVFSKLIRRKGYGWQKRALGQENAAPKGKGLGGFCVCPKCGYKIEHQKGIPCSQMSCPKCKTALQRK